MDSVGRRAEADWRDAPRRAALDRASAAALAVDTLLVRPDSLILRAGTAIHLFDGPITWVARDRAGDAVPGFVPWFRVDNSRVVAVRGDELVALAAGRGALLLTVGIRSDSMPPRILHVTRLPVVVR